MSKSNEIVQCKHTAFAVSRSTSIDAVKNISKQTEVLNVSDESENEISPNCSKLQHDFLDDYEQLEHDEDIVNRLDMELDNTRNSPYSSSIEQDLSISVNRKQMLEQINKDIMTFIKEGERVRNPGSTEQMPPPLQPAENKNEHKSTHTTGSDELEVIEITESLPSHKYDTRLASTESSSEFRVSASSGNLLQRPALRNINPANSAEYTWNGSCRKYPEMSGIERILRWDYQSDISDVEDYAQIPSSFDLTSLELTQKQSKLRAERLGRRSPCKREAKKACEQNENSGCAENVVFSINTRTGQLCYTENAIDNITKNAESCPIDQDQSVGFDNQNSNSHVTNNMPNIGTSKHEKKNTRRKVKKNMVKPKFKNPKVPTTEDNVINNNVDTDYKEEFYKYLGLETKLQGDKFENDRNNGKRRSPRFKTMQNPVYECKEHVKNPDSHNGIEYEICTNEDCTENMQRLTESELSDTDTEKIGHNLAETSTSPLSRLTSTPKTFNNNLLGQDLYTLPTSNIMLKYTYSKRNPVEIVNRLPEDDSNNMELSSKNDSYEETTPTKSSTIKCTYISDDDLLETAITANNLPFARDLIQLPNIYTPNSNRSDRNIQSSTRMKSLEYKYRMDKNNSICKVQTAGFQNEPNNTVNKQSTNHMSCFIRRGYQKVALPNSKFYFTNLNDKSEKDTLLISSVSAYKSDPSSNSDVENLHSDYQKERIDGRHLESDTEDSSSSSDIQVQNCNLTEKGIDEDLNKLPLHKKRKKFDETFVEEDKGNIRTQNVVLENNILESKPGKEIESKQNLLNILRCNPRRKSPSNTQILKKDKQSNSKQEKKIEESRKSPLRTDFVDKDVTENFSVELCSFNEIPRRTYGVRRSTKREQTAPLTNTTNSNRIAQDSIALLIMKNNSNLSPEVQYNTISENKKESNSDELIGSESKFAKNKIVEDSKCLRTIKQTKKIKRKYIRTTRAKNRLLKVVRSSLTSQQDLHDGNFLRIISKKFKKTKKVRRKVRTKVRKCSLPSETERLGCILSPARKAEMEKEDEILKCPVSVVVIKAKDERNLKMPSVEGALSKINETTNGSTNVSLPKSNEHSEEPDKEKVTETNPKKSTEYKETSSLKHINSALLSNPLKQEDGIVLHAYYCLDYLVVVQKFRISFWRYSKLIQMFGKSQQWEPLVDLKRKLEDEEILSPYKNRICINESYPVYLEMRARQFPDDPYRECNMAAVYVNIYFFNKETSTAGSRSVQLDTVRGIATDITYTTITGSRYFIMCWKQEGLVNTSKTGLCKYSLTPDLDTLASIREFKYMRHVVRQIECLDGEKLIGFGEAQVTIWNHRTGDVLTNFDLEMSIGMNLGSVLRYFESKEFLILYQNRFNNTVKIPELKIFAVNLGQNPHSFRLIYTHELPTSFTNIASSLGTEDFLFATANNGDELLLLPQQPHRLFYFNRSSKSKNINRFYSTGNQNFVEISDDNLLVKTIHEYLIDFIK